MSNKILYLDLFEYPTSELAQAAWVTDAAGLELDYFDYATDPIAQTAYVSDADVGLTADIFDEPCDDFTTVVTWADADEGDAVSEISPAGQFHFTSATSTGQNAIRNGDVGSYPDVFTYEIKLYHDDIGTRANEDDFYTILRIGADEQLYISWNSDGLYIYDTDEGGFIEVGTDLVKSNGSAEWQIWRFLCTFTAVTGEATCDVYLKDSTHDWEKVGTAVPCSVEVGGTDGLTTLAQRGNTTVSQETHIDWIKAAAGLHIPVLDLQCYSESTIIQQGSYSLKVVAQQTGSLNDTLTKSGLSIDLSGRAELKIDFYALRTGTNIQMQIHDSGGQTSTKDIAISSANTWETTTWDISAIADVDKDNIDQIIIKIINADEDNTFYVDNFRVEESLQCYSEDTIKVQGDYSLKVLAAQTDSLNKTLTKTLTDYLDYSIQDVIKFDVRASRTGTNIQLQIHDVGGVTSSHNINIAVADTWQTETWDISGITGTDRDTIDKIIIKTTEATVSNTIYMDNLYSQVIVESAHVFIGG